MDEGCGRPVAGGDGLRRACDAMRGSWGSCGLGPDPGFGPRRVARAAAAPEGLDDDHAPAAARAWRTMVGWRRGGGLGRRVGRRWRLGCGEQLPGTGNVRLARGAREEPLMADAVYIRARAGLSEFG